jgi:hypothetical protein
MPKPQDSWVQHVMDNYTSTDPPKGIFTASPETIADAADVEGVAPKGLTSWQRMVLFHRNRGGKGLSEERRQTLQQAIQALTKRRLERRQGINGFKEDTLLPHTLIPAQDFAKRLAQEVTQHRIVSNKLPAFGAGLGQATGGSNPYTDPDTGSVNAQSGKVESDASKHMAQKIQTKEHRKQ